MLRPNKLNSDKSFCRLGLTILLMSLAAPVLAQDPPNPEARTPQPEKKPGEYTINVDVNLVVLHATVLDKKSRHVDNHTPIFQSPWALSSTTAEACARNAWRSMRPP